MSVPSVVSSNQLGHLFSLSGSGIAIVNSLNIQSLSHSRKYSYPQNDLYNNLDVLPSINQSRKCSANSIRPNFTTECIERHCTSARSKKFDYVREANFIIQDGNRVISIEPIRYYNETRDKSDDEDISEPRESETEIGDPETEIAKVKELKRSKRKDRRKQKKRASSRKSSSEPNKRKDSRVENIYNDISELTGTSNDELELQAFCTPIHAIQQSRKEKKPVTDYLKHANTKAPCVPKVLRNNSNEKVNVPSRTKEYAISLQKNFNFDEPQYVQHNREAIRHFHDQQNVLYGAKLSTKGSQLANSTECSTFRPAVPKQANPHVLRRTLGSAPIEERSIRIFQSDKQSTCMSEMGLEFPCPPPSTPEKERFLNIEWVPSMSDIRSQRSLKMRLESMQQLEKQKKERLKEEQLRLYKMNQKEQIKELRKQQRREIYALNKKMTEFEHNNFREFCSKNGIKCDE